MATRMQQRRGTAQQWTDADPILAAGEIGFETDTNQFKIGDGVNAWSDLSYFKNLEDLGGSLDDYVPVATKGQPNGVAELDNTGKIPSSQIPALVGLDSEISSAVSAAVADLVDGAPEALNTLNEIATLIGDGSSLGASLVESLGALDTAIANHSNDTSNVHGLVIADVATHSYVGTAVTTHDSHTINVHGIADTSALATKTYADDAVTVHNQDSTNVHGIADTTELATKTYANDAVSTHNADTTNVHGIADTSALALSVDVASDIAAHSADTTDVHGITNTANLVYTSDSRLSNERTPSAGSVTAAKIASDAVETAKIKDLNVTTAKIADSAITSAKIADGTIVDGDISSSAAIAQSKISGLTSDLAAKAPLASPTFTGTVSGITKSMVGLGNVDNTSDASKPVSTATQTALDAKAPLASPTFTGTVAGITKSMVGLGNVDNTSDANKPVSTATQTALDAKLALAGGTMTGSLTLSGAPTSDLHAATKAYVDGISAGINFHQAVVAATSGNLAGVYDNGTNGYGATITASANGSIGTIDGATVSVGSRILLRAQTDATQNGIYVVTNVGSGSTKWVVTRAADADNNPTGELATGDFCFVTGGNTYPNTGFILSTSGTITIGTTNVTYTQFNAAQAIVAGTGLSKTGSTLSIDTATTVDLSTAQTLSNKTFVAPALGVATATSINGTTIPSSKTLVTTADSGTVTSTMIADGTIVDADINASAAIAQSKISGLTSALSAKAPLATPSFTGGVTVDSSGIIFTDGTQTKAGVPSITTIATAIASSATLAAGEQDKFVPLTGAVQITLPATGYSNGQSIDFYQASGTGASFASTNGVVGTPGLKFRTTYSVVTAMKISGGWLVFGDLSA